MRTNIVIRADGGSSIGMGHVVRCLALGEILKNDFNIVFAIQDPSESVINTIQSLTKNSIRLPSTGNYNDDCIDFKKYLNSSDIVVLDGYHFKTEYQTAIKNKGCKLVCIDDLHAWHHVSDAIINHANGVDPLNYSAEKYTQLYLGLKYALLRKEFLTPDKKIHNRRSIKKIFVSMGAADIGNLTHKFTEALLNVKNIEEIHLMFGSINPHLPSIQKLVKENKEGRVVIHFNISAVELRGLLEECDIAVCPASSIAIESCAVGIGLVSGYTAQNQLGILEGLITSQVLINLGDLNKITKEEIQHKFEQFIVQPGQINKLMEHQKQMIDGKSPERLLTIFKNMAN